LLLKIYNGTETKAGVSVKLTTETFTDYDFVLNTAEETFRLPIKVKNTPMGGTAPVLAGSKINDFDSGLSWRNADGSKFNSTNTILYAYGVGDTTNGVYHPTTGVGSSTGDTVYQVLAPANLYADLSQATNPDLYLYFYVGETVQNANLINAGRIEEKLVDFIPDNKIIITGYCTPDYTKGINITFKSTGFTYTAPANGFVSVQLLISANTLGELKINGVTVLRGNSGTKDTFGDFTGQVVVRKGDVITAVNGYDGTLTQYNWATFYPMKGAN